jgi:transcriptional regulator with XRE-family HTH domain
MKKQLTYDELIALLRRRIKECGSQKDFAAVAGISAQYVSDVLHRRREPGEAILSALKLEKVVTYKEKE